ASPPIHTRTHRTHRKPRRHKRIRKSALLPHTTGTRQKRKPRNRHHIRRWPSARKPGGRGPTNRNRKSNQPQPTNRLDNPNTTRTVQKDPTVGSIHRTGWWYGPNANPPTRLENPYPSDVHPHDHTRRTLSQV